jgi:hypothetical protein
MKIFRCLVLLILLFTLTACVITRNYRYVDRVGEKAMAEVLDISDTGITINKNPKVRLVLKVFPKGRPPYEAVIKQVVSRLTVPRIGDRVKVKYDPENPANVILLYRK